MTEQIRKRAEELAEEAYANVSNYRNIASDARIARGGYIKAMFCALPIIERLMNPEHDDGCSYTVTSYDTMPPMQMMVGCNCTLGKAREEARKLVGG